MYEIGTTGKLCHWPSPQDYNEAIQNPATSFKDGLLRFAQPELDCFGLPKPISGGFASVYKMNHGEDAWAVRCFLLHIEDQEKRYEQISSYLRLHGSEYTLPFQYLTDGIKVNSKWFPVLKMEWFQGQTLEQYIDTKIDKPAALAALSEQFLQLCQQLQNAEIAHGDLQHGNILVSKRGMMLVDYDGMFVPTMRGQASLECGHRNYQHPERRSHHFGSYLDNFSAWVIYASLEAIARDPRLYNRLKGGADCLLLRESDFLKPSESESFSILEGHSDPRVVSLARFVRGQLDRKVEQVPRLQQEPPEVSVPPLRKSYNNRSTVEPWWLQDIETKAPVIDFNSFANTGVKRILSSTPAANAPGQNLRGMPAELNQPLPRRVGFNSKCGRVSPILKQLFVLLAPHTWIQVMLFWTSITSCLLYTYGTDSTGVVTAKSVESYRTKSGAEEETNIIAYEYTNGSEVYRHNTRQPKGIADPKVGDPVYIRTLGSIELGDPSPRFSANDPYVQQDPLLGFLPFGPVLIGVEIWLWAEAIKHWWLAKHGCCTSGEITSKDITNGSKGEKYHKCSYSFTVNGVAQHAKMNISEKEWNSIKKGDSVIVLYSTHNPGMSCIYAFAYMIAKP